MVIYGININTLCLSSGSTRSPKVAPLLTHPLSFAKTAVDVRREPKSSLGGRTYCVLKYVSETNGHSEGLHLMEVLKCL